MFRPKNFPKGLGERAIVPAAWLHQDSHTLYFVTRSEPQVRWSRSKQLRDRQWDLFVLHYDPSQKLLYLHSSDTSSLHEELAQAVGGRTVKLIQGETVFRCLGRITRLMFQNIGVKKVGRRNLRYAMYTGVQVEEALSLAEKAGSVKANLAGGGVRGRTPSHDRLLVQGTGVVAGAWADPRLHRLVQGDRRQAERRFDRHGRHPGQRPASEGADDGSRGAASSASNGRSNCSPSPRDR